MSNDENFKIRFKKLAEVKEFIERKAGALSNSYEYAPNSQLTAAIADGMGGKMLGMKRN